MKKITRTQKTIILAGAGALILAALTLSFTGYINGFKHPERLSSPTSEQQAYLTDYLNQTYPAKRVNVLRGLPYSTVDAKLDIAAESAILIDTANGCVLLKKMQTKPFRRRQLQNSLSCTLSFRKWSQDAYLWMM